MIAKLRFNPLRWVRFTTRDLVWLVVVVALASAIYRPHMQSLLRTGRELDLKISGQGYFLVEHAPSGRRGFWRQGRMGINPVGQLCAGKGTALEGWTLVPRITISSDYEAIDVTHDGIVSCRQTGNPQRQQAGQLLLAKFVNPEGLREVVDGIYEETQDSGSAMVVVPGLQGTGFLEQGRLDAPPPQSPFDAVTFTCILCSGAALVCMREVRLLRNILASGNVA